MRRSGPPGFWARPGYLAFSLASSAFTGLAFFSWESCRDDAITDKTIHPLENKACFLWLLLSFFFFSYSAVWCIFGRFKSGVEQLFMWQALIYGHLRIPKMLLLLQKHTFLPCSINKPTSFFKNTETAQQKTLNSGHDWWELVSPYVKYESPLECSSITDSCSFDWGSNPRLGRSMSWTSSFQKNWSTRSELCTKTSTCSR